MGERVGWVPPKSLAWGSGGRTPDRWIRVQPVDQKQPDGVMQAIGEPHILVYSDHVRWVAKGLEDLRPGDTLGLQAGLDVSLVEGTGDWRSGRLYMESFVRLDHIEGMYLYFRCGGRLYRVIWDPALVVIPPKPKPDPIPSSSQSATATQEEDTHASLRRVLDLAYRQSKNGKGLERHGSAGTPFDDQPIFTIGKLLGTNHGQVFQAVKKLTESTRLAHMGRPESARAELLGAIVYTAAAYLALANDKEEDKDA